MPNQRASNKIYLGGFVEKPFHRKFMTLARKEGKADNKFGFAIELLEEAVECRKIRRAQPAKRLRHIGR